MTRPRGWAVFHDPDNLEAFRQIYAGFKNILCKPLSVFRDPRYQDALH